MQYTDYVICFGSNSVIIPTKRLSSNVLTFIIVVLDKAFLFFIHWITLPASL